MNYTDNPRLAALELALRVHMATVKPVSEYMNHARAYEKDDELYMREAHFIIAVGPGEGKSMSEIAEELFVSVSAVSQTAKRLEQKGYIVRRRDRKNYKKIIATLTEKGEAFYHRHMEHDTSAFDSMDKEWFSQFTDEELERFVRFEYQILASFSSSNERERKKKY